MCYFTRFFFYLGKGKRRCLSLFQLQKGNKEFRMSIALYLIEELSNDKGKVIGAIFIDFSKAFDSLEHYILG